MRIKITATTTDAEILAPITAARRTLATAASKAAVGEVTVETLHIGEQHVALAQNVRSAEDVARAQMFYRDVCKLAPEERLDYLFDLVIRCDDTGSGRRNDSVRSSHDAVVAWARDEAHALRYTHEAN